METQFEVVSNLTRKQHVEVYRKFMGKRFLWVALAGAAGIFFLVRGIFQQSFLLIVCGLLELFIGVRVYALPWRRARKVMKENQEYEGTQRISSKTSFSDEEIVDESSRVILKFPYDKIKKIYISDDLIVLVDIRGMGIIMNRYGFTKGDFGQFMEFIRMKCPQLKLPQW